MEDSRYLCTACYGGYVPPKRWKLGYNTCLPCGEQAAKEKAKKFTVLTVRGVLNVHAAIRDLEEMRA